MWIRKRSWFAAAYLASALPFITTAATVEGLDGNKNMVCAVIKVVGCVEDSGCVLGKAAAFDMPTLVVYDAKGKVVRGTHESAYGADIRTKRMILLSNDIADNLFGQ